MALLHSGKPSAAQWQTCRCYTCNESKKRGDEEEVDSELMAHGEMIRLQRQIRTSSQNCIKVFSKGGTPKLMGVQPCPCKLFRLLQLYEGDGIADRREEVSFKSKKMTTTTYPKTDLSPPLYL